MQTYAIVGIALLVLGIVLLARTRGSSTAGSPPSRLPAILFMIAGAVFIAAGFIP